MIDMDIRCRTIIEVNIQWLVWSERSVVIVMLHVRESDFVNSRCHNEGRFDHILRATLFFEGARKRRKGARVLQAGVPFESWRAPEHGCRLKTGLNRTCRVSTYFAGWHSCERAKWRRQRPISDKSDQAQLNHTRKHITPKPAWERKLCWVLGPPAVKTPSRLLLALRCWMALQDQKWRFY